MYIKSIPFDPSNSSMDWRIRMFGDYIQSNVPSRVDIMEQPSMKNDDDLEAPSFGTKLIPTQEALDPTKYDYIAVFIGADYCPHCKAFAPTVHSAAATLEEKRCKVVFVSNDRTEEAFQASCRKNASLDIMPYDVSKTKVLRDIFDLKTIPALLILRNNDFDASGPPFVTNARNTIAVDPDCLHFPWKKSEVPEQISLMDRMFIRGKYGRWWELGHHSNPEHPEQIYMDEHAVRIRAGFLNVISWLAVINIFIWREPNFVRVVYPIVAFEFITSANFGMTPIAPIGVISTIMASILQPTPYWKPAKPKRFAWYVGLFLATSCLTIFLLRKEIDKDLYTPLIGLVALSCMLATWLESSAGFCLGCFVYNTWMVPYFKMEECSECKL